jgi:predicted membrane-bound spermidine synthase
VRKGLLVLILIYCVCLYTQFYGIYLHYFEFTNPDKISLALSLAIPFFLAHRFLAVDHFIPKYIGVSILIAVPILVRPLTSNLIGWSDYTWIVIHVLIAIGGVLAASITTQRWVILPFLSLVAAWLIPFEYQQTQTKYYDKVVANVDTRLGSSQIVQWKNDYWVHYNDELQFSTIDDHVLKEAFIQPVMHINDSVKDVLIIGSDEGLLSQELSKFSSISKITHLPYDKGYHEFIGSNSELLQIDLNKKTKIVYASHEDFLADTISKFDLIIIDLAEPTEVEFVQFYSTAFYQLCFNKLTTDGSMVTKIANSYPRFGQIEKTQLKVQAAGFDHLVYHVQIPSIGQCSWIIGSKKMSASEMMTSLKTVTPKVETTWWNLEAMKMMLSFGKTSYFSSIVYESVSVKR